MGIIMKMILGLLLVVFSLGLLSCGGGGGGGAAGGGGGGGIAYTGVTTQATVTNTNAQNMALTAFQGSQIAGAMGVGSVKEGKETITQPVYYNFSEALKEAVLQIDFNLTGNVAAGAIINRNQTLNGPGGGTASVSFQIDDTTGNFTGTITFNSYCSGGTTLTGTVTVTGGVNLTTGYITQITMSSNLMTVISSGVSYSFKINSFTITAGPTNTTITMDIYLSNSSGTVFWVSNLSVSTSTGSDANGSYTNATMTGRFYDSTYGYVDLTTPTPFRFYSTGTRPTQGVLLLTGQNNTKARLTVVSSTQYRVDCDANGDGTYEWSSGNQTW